MKIANQFILLITSILLLNNTAKAQFLVTASSYLGDVANDDHVRGSKIQSNGIIVLAVTIGNARPGNLTPILLNNAGASTNGAIIRLSADGRTVLSVTRLATTVNDLALDGANNIYVAAGTAGVFKLTPNADAVIWNRLSGSYVHRVDAAANGFSAALAPNNVGGADTNGGPGKITAFNADGTIVGEFTGYHNTQDVALDAASQTINTVGWRQTNAFDSSRTEPVQISYLRGYAYDGAVKWTAYDWSTDPGSPRFLNRPENNMADTRGVRCAIGRDGKLYAAFECAGGNHMFRYSTTDISQRAAIVGGDNYHNFSNTRSEHKTFFGRYEPATGAYLRGQQLVNRLSNGRGNTIVAKEICADETGQVYIGGAAAFGLPPLTLNPPGLGDYTGGAWLIIMSSDFTRRLFVTRLNAGGQTSAIDARSINGAVTIAWGGSAKISDGHYLLNAVQPTAGGGTNDGFFTVVGAVTVLSNASARGAGPAMLLFPNPAHNQFTITYEASQRGPARVEILDALGRVVVPSQEHLTQPGANRLRVQLPSLPRGLYHVRMQQNGSTISQKLILTD